VPAGVQFASLSCFYRKMLHVGGTVYLHVLEHTKRSWGKANTRDLHNYQAGNLNLY